MAERCECGHYEPSHQMVRGRCFICPCEKFKEVEPDMGPGTTVLQNSTRCLYPVDRAGIIPVLDSIAKTLRDTGEYKAADYVSGYRDTIETQPAVKAEPLSLTEARGVLLVLEMLSQSKHCWCAAGMSDLVPDHNEICLKVQALHQVMDRKAKRKG